MEDEVTTIAVEKKTRDRLAKFCAKAQTYDDILNEIMDHLEKNDYIYNKLRSEASRCDSVPGAGGQ